MKETEAELWEEIDKLEMKKSVEGLSKAQEARLVDAQIKVNCMEAEKECKEVRDGE